MCGRGEEGGLTFFSFSLVYGILKFKEKSSIKAEENDGLSIMFP